MLFTHQSKLNSSLGSLVVASWLKFETRKHITFGQISFYIFSKMHISFLAPLHLQHIYIRIKEAPVHLYYFIPKPGFVKIIAHMHHEYKQRGSQMHTIYACISSVPDKKTCCSNQNYNQACIMNDISNLVNFLKFNFKHLIFDSSSPTLYAASQSFSTQIGGIIGI